MCLKGAEGVELLYCEVLCIDLVGDGLSDFCRLTDAGQGAGAGSIVYCVSLVRLIEKGKCFILLPSSVPCKKGIYCLGLGGIGW